MLDENFIGGHDLEAIEMQEESFLDKDDVWDFTLFYLILNISK